MESLVLRGVCSRVVDGFVFYRRKREDGVLERKDNERGWMIRPILNMEKERPRIKIPVRR